MDSVTHLFLGAALAAAVAPARHRRAALLAGAALCTVPDLDVIPLALWADPVDNMTWHRGPTHSLLLLVPFGLALWAWLRRRGGRVAEAPRAWLWAILLPLCLHPVVDAFTVYGTQLFWPLPLAPAMWSTLFIIDPLFTLPVLVACVVAWSGRWRPAAGRALMLGLALSGAYLGWSVVAKLVVEQRAERALAALGWQDAPRFSVPMPFNTLLWRVVVMTPDGYLEADHSLVADTGPMQFRAYRHDAAALEAVAGYPAVSRLLWFNQGFMKAETRDGRLVLSDLRMGVEPDYSFRFAVAVPDGRGWRETAPEQLAWPWNARRRLPSLWRRIWTPMHAVEGDPP